jgi:hypothetical protein
LNLAIQINSQKLTKPLTSNFSNQPANYQTQTHLTFPPAQARRQPRPVNAACQPKTHLKLPFPGLLTSPGPIRLAPRPANALPRPAPRTAQPAQPSALTPLCATAALAPPVSGSPCSPFSSASPHAARPPPQPHLLPHPRARLSSPRDKAPQPPGLRAAALAEKRLLPLSPLHLLPATPRARAPARVAPWRGHQNPPASPARLAAAAHAANPAPRAPRPRLGEALDGRHVAPCHGHHITAVSLGVRAAVEHKPPCDAAYKASSGPAVSPQP